MLLQDSNNPAEVRIKSTWASPKAPKHLKSMQWKFFSCLCGLFLPFDVGRFGLLGRWVYSYLWQGSK